MAVAAEEVLTPAGPPAPVVRVANSVSPADIASIPDEGERAQALAALQAGSTYDPKARAPAPAPRSTTGPVSLPTDKLGIGMGAIPSLPQIYNDQLAENTRAMQDAEKFTAQEAAARTEGAQKVAAVQARAPADPVLTELPKNFAHLAMPEKEMNDSLQTMFLLSAIGGAMTRQPMTAALNAFAGAMKGMAEGDAVAYKREHETFDRNLKLATEKNKEALEAYKLAFEKHKGDLTATLQEVQLKATAFRDSATAALARAGNAKAVMAQMAALANTDTKTQQLFQNFELQHQRVEQSIQAQRDRMDLQERQLASLNANRDAVNRLSAERNQLKASSMAQGGKPSPTERQHYVDSNSLLKSVDRVEQMLANPEIRAKIDDSRVANFLSDSIESKAIQQFLVRPNLDPDVKNYLSEVAALRNQYYLDMSGKAVTGGEALRNYGAVMQPGDTSEDVYNKMQIAKARTTEKMRDMETYFPSLAVIRGGAKPPGGGGAIVPPKNAKGWGLQKDAQGNQAYVGPNGEIEEVK